MTTLLLEADVLKESAVRQDKESLQGCWEFVSGVREAQLFIAGDHFTVKFKNGDLYVGTFELDPTREPKAIDMLIYEGPERHKGKSSLGIYELAGDHLIWAPGDPGSDHRPAAFPARDDKNHLCIVLVREKPQRVTP